MHGSPWPLALSLFLFGLMTAVIGVVGWKVTRVADRLADMTGLGEAIFGAVFLGATTSLPGIVASVTTAYSGEAAFPVSHALGGIALQTAFLAVADASYRKANLEHAAASTENLIQGVLLVLLLGLILLAAHGPELTLWAIHPVTLGLAVSYWFGLSLVRESHATPMWSPKITRFTKGDIPDEPAAQERLSPLVWRFGLFAVILAVAGWTIGRAALSIAADTGLSQTLVGGLFTTASTSLPELVTTLAAVRQGALTLAVGIILGGNSFDTLMVAVSDVAYRQGSIYHAIGASDLYLGALAILMTSVLLLGLLRREEKGFANIGLESLLTLVIYIAGLVFLFVIG